MDEEKAIEIVKNITESDLLNCWSGGNEEYKAIQVILNLVKTLQKDLTIVDEYASLLGDILCDYDGYYDPETKKGSLEGLASLVDEAMDYCDKIRNRDTTSIMYEDCNDNKYNILHEKIKEEENNG